MQNFGKIKNVFNSLLIEGVLKKDDASKKLFKKYVKTIKESEILKTQFLVYSNIENKVDSDAFSANMFISENIKLLEKYTPSEIIKENKKLANLLNNSVGKLDEEYELSKLHESLSNLIITKRTPKNVEKITEEIKNITSFILSNNPKEVSESFNLPVSVLSKIMIEKYNQKYSAIEKEEKEILKTLINSNVDSKKELYSKITNECIGLIDNLLKESNEESTQKLKSVKERLVEDATVFKQENFLIKISKLIELKNNLKNT
jgi:hypothetical protein